jgi:hypothetical protein
VRRRIEERDKEVDFAAQLTEILAALRRVLENVLGDEFARLGVLNDTEHVVFVRLLLKM